MQAQEVDLRKRNTTLEGKLMAAKVSCMTVEAKVESHQKQMKTLVVDETLHAQAKLMEGYKAGKHTKWDSDYEIGVWKDKEAELIDRVSVEEREEGTSPMRS